MDDPESEWEIQESSRGNCDNGKLSWMLRLGRKILVTGIVISSAPLVLPPLMAISAIGLVFSVPYGIFLVSYVCTETVMSRLLPMPSPTAPLLLEYREPFNGEEEANGDEDQGGQNEVIKGGISIEREEEELKEDTIEEIEMRIELVDEEQEELDKGNILQEGEYKKPGVENDEKKSMEEIDEIVPVQLVQAIDVEENEKLLIGARGLSERIRDEKKTDCEVDDKQRAERVNVGGVEKQPKEIEVKTEGTTEVKEEQYLGGESMSEQPIKEVCNIVVEFEGDEKNGSNNEKETPFQIEKVAVQSSASTDIEEDEDLGRETRGLLEKIRDEGKTNYVVDDKWSTEKEHVGTEKDDMKIVGDVEKAKTRCIIAHDVMGKTTREFEPKVEENKADNKVQIKESVENLDALSKETKLGKDAEGLSEEMDVDNIPRRAQSVGPGSETVNDGSSRKELTVESAIFPEGGQAEDDNENNVDQNYLLNKEKKDATFSNDDERETNDEQELDLLEDLSTVSQQGSASDVNTFEESQPSSSHLVHQEISDPSELPVSTKAQESDDIRISAENAIDTASIEALYSEEKIWEQINALRTIVGYKAARQETYIEELKALYLLTGIEPPASLNNTCDLVEFNDKLRFLMSVVGVK
ncbi:hypothetical protein CRYUN_Cryun08bG0065100 [Craigia yunnanensis]